MARIPISRQCLVVLGAASGYFLLWGVVGWQESLGKKRGFRKAGAVHVDRHGYDAH